MLRRASSRILVGHMPPVSAPSPVSVSVLFLQWLPCFRHGTLLKQGWAEQPWGTVSTKLPLCSSSRCKHSLCFIAGMLDVQQIFGRAGRPQYESSGLGVILTQHANLSHYLGMLTHQLPIESQFVSLLVDNLNAEIVLGEQQLSLPIAISQPPPSQPHVPPCRRMPVMGSIPNP